MTATETTPAHLTSAEPFVPIQTRSERPTSFDPAEFGTPTGREVNWRLSDIKRLAPLFVDEETETGDDIGIDYQLGELESRGLLVESTGHDTAPRGEIFRPEDVVSAIAWKRCANALHIRLPEGQVQEEPVIARLIGKGADRHSNAHIVIEAMPGSVGTIVLHHSGSALYAQNLEIIVREGARLTLISVQDWEDDTVHASSHQAVVGEGAYLKHMVVSFGGGVARVNPSMRLAGLHAEGDMYGLSFADSGQHIESQVFMFHEGVSTRGNVLYKGALQGTGARSVWIGDVLIGNGATDTDSYEKNQNLVLTDGARADSIPNLEIQTGDIAGAGHASATGRFDDEQLFYLESRGIEEEEARRLVVIGFLMEIVQKIGVPEIEQRLAEAIEEELRRGAGLAPATKAGA
ncbi:Iron-regulated ABC transporter permease protein SufD [Agrococcus baldri]|uniref:Iron-regulated ABC transporter permease protein SufD n=1 Tax=Agrococcus baldri TaxID=153730 RepID=A0AA94HPT6_9MICO|nr:Fe-S cluster assembly protein SufD [Agrococcus baldri]SFS18371.1 Iron-regulated ABC transporter permease protein SufD [Agrococcus baldri]